MIELKHQYPLGIGGSILSELSEFLTEHFEDHKLFILVDENTEKHCLPFLNWVDHSQLLNAEVLTIPAGEESKCLAIVERLAETLIELRAGRKTLIINLGGGVVTDLGGYLASCYKRGIPFINLPTTLLAMIDASVGGKTGVNVGNYKNQVGAFHFPSAVYCGTEFLKSLPEAELKSGYSELIKHALISDIDLWNELQGHQLNSIPGEELIARSVKVKAQIVERDPREGGERKKLNFGHTFGHAIESLSHQKGKPLLHGEAVAIGMIVESWISARFGNLAQSSFDKIHAYLKSQFSIFTIDEGDFMPLLDFMQADKKNEDMAINFTLLEEIGVSSINHGLSEIEVDEAFQWYASICV